MPILDSSQRLKKELGLFDVFAVSTGAMFSSGFFLLPGLAAAQAGPSVFLAYLIAGVLIMPAMFSQGELSTALPRAGGAYFFLDRSLGPIAGTIGGLGTFLALTLKTAFALIGIGAYASLFMELPIKLVAIVLTVVFVTVNIFGAKETTRLQRWLVILLLSVLAFFTVQGILYLLFDQPMAQTKAQFVPFLPFGLEGLFSTVGFVFVSYAGLTKVASVAEEIKNPDRNIPLGMMLSLGVTSVVYVVGVFIMVAVLPPEALRSDMTPVATAAEAFFGWLPKPMGLILIVAAALAAFASTGNAGLMSASRYPLAMARDRLLPDAFAQIGRFKTPTTAILATGGLMIAFILFLDAEGIAKLASAFQLFMFILINFAVVVMRQSGLPSYDPGFRSPLYPWMQIFGMITSLLLIVYMGWLAVLFTVGVIIICLAWYYHYARWNVERDGAIYHWFHILGRRQYEGLDREFRSIMKEKGLRDEDPFDEIVANSFVIDLKEKATLEEVIQKASELLAQRLPKTAENIAARFTEGTVTGATPVTHEVAMPHFRLPHILQPELVVVRTAQAVPFPTDGPLGASEKPERGVRTLFFLVSPEDDPGQHLRVLAQIAGRVDEPHFAEAWFNAQDEQELRETLLRDERFISIPILPGTPAKAFEGKALKELDLPEGCLIALIRREEGVIVPNGNTVLLLGDRLTVIGQPDALAQLHTQFDPSDQEKNGS